MSTAKFDLTLFLKICLVVTIIPSSVLSAKKKTSLAIFEHRLSANESKIFCSGVVVSKHLILTSRYCALESYKLRQHDKTIVRVGSRVVGDGGKVHTIEAIHYHPKFDIERNPLLLSPYHIVAVRTKEPIRCAKCEPMKLADKEILDDALQPDTTVQIPVFSLSGNKYILKSLESTILLKRYCKEIIYDLGYDEVKSQKCFLVSEVNAEKIREMCELGNKGGPVTLENKLLGIVEFMDPPIENSEPVGGFNSIKSSHEWITKLIIEDNSCKKNTSKKSIYTNM